MRLTRTTSRNVRADARTGAGPSGGSGPSEPHGSHGAAPHRGPDARGGSVRRLSGALRATLVAATAVAAAVGVTVAVMPPASASGAGSGAATASGQRGVAAQELCGTTDSASVEGGKYVVQNNVWGASTPQCISVDGASFEVTRAEHDNPTTGSPASYPSIYAGCHYGKCTEDSGLPLRVDAMKTVTSSWSTSTPSDGAWDAAYDIWFDPDAKAQGQNQGELMIWDKHQGGVQPAGEKTGTVTIGGATYEVWTGDIGWKVISYVRTTPVDSVTGLDLHAFADDAAKRGSIQSSWYMTSVQAGFEPWQGGKGLKTNSFSLQVG